MKTYWQVVNQLKRVDGKFTVRIASLSMRLNHLKQLLKDAEADDDKASIQASIEGVGKVIAKVLLRKEALQDNVAKSLLGAL